MSRPRVAIIGAGPAGCAAATVLARRDIAAVMFERGRPGKDKACGDAFMGEAVSALTALGMMPRDLERLGAAVSAVSLFAHGAQLWTWRLGKDTGFVMPRKAFDQALRDRTASTTDLRYETRVRNIVATGRNQWTIDAQGPGGREDINVDGVIIAAGSADGLARRLGVDGRPTRFWSVTGYRHGHQPQILAFDFLLGLRPGYGWCFPVGENQVNIGICAFSPTKGHALRAAFDTYVQSRESSGIAGCPSLRGGVGNGWSGQGRLWHLGGGVISCGDAAGLIDPLTGEGLGPALQSGLRAGTAMAEYCLYRHDGPLEAYSAWVREHYGDRHAGTSLRRNWAELCGFKPLMPDQMPGSAEGRR